MSICKHCNTELDWMDIEVGLDMHEDCLRKTRVVVVDENSKTFTCPVDSGDECVNCLHCVGI